jgi:ferrous iron transport protein B
MAIFSAYILNKILKIKGKRILLSKCPIINCRFSRTLSMLSKKTKAFILVRVNYSRYIDSSMVLASYGPGEKFNNAEKIITEKTIIRCHNRI